ncbi:hypothetical protein K431DRAFT_304543 [Polychaeton citri CBS 116435]|uniref:Glutathione synthetase ATP-binding domain-like protein n=1 Tax=Polychaeton citri CBS 116435 TaxID=1314669 RepID=A0A9P4Q8K8_9PEZI|nr:hypothetical protein K431DRAFT_304543 [Polychaeton citri CBS 116435]
MRVDTFKLRWSASNRSTGDLQHPYWQSVNITTQKLSQPVNGHLLYKIETDAHTIDERLAGIAHGPKFLSTLLSAAASAPPGRGRAAKLVIPRTRGYIVRSDIISLRMFGCPHVIHTTSFAKPQQWFLGEKLTEADIFDLRDVIAAAAASVILDTGRSMSYMMSDLDSLGYQFQNRLSFSWVLQERQSRQILAFVGNYLKYPGHGGTGANHGSVAKALNINMWAHDRIIEALSKYNGKIGGIVTFHESLSAGVARAAQLLSLPTASPEALIIADDKYRASVTEGNSEFLASSVDNALEITKQRDLQNPLILKPCRCGCSEGVRKVDNVSETSSAAQDVSSLFDWHGAQFVVEEYFDGPEVDVNMMLRDGELLLVDIWDNFPKCGEPGMTNVEGGTFMETGMVHSSKLPSSELNMLSRSLHQSLLRLGIESGIFNLEAREGL